MELIKLWDADIKKAYVLQNNFDEEENGFVNTAYGYTFAQFQAYVKLKQGYSVGKNLPEGFVSDSTYILEVDGNYVGIFNLRHELNDFLRQHAGHIGYGIAKPYRHKGYATRGLKLLIDKAKEIIKEDEIYMSVHKDNAHSLRVQTNNGAYIVGENEEDFLTRIKMK